MRFPIRKKTKVPRGQVSHIAEQEAPIKGWIASENIVGTDPLGAFQLDNWFPEPNAIILRPGYAQWNFISGGTAINTLMVYESGSKVQMFAISGNAIYDVTANAPSVAAPFTSANQTDMTNIMNVMRRSPLPYDVLNRKGVLPV